MMDIIPAPQALLRLIHCNCSNGCNTLRCSCKKHGLNCSPVCGPCQHLNCDNMIEVVASDEESNDGN